MDDEQPDHSHPHLSHLVMMGVKHLCAVLAQRPFVFHRFARFDIRLRQAADAVHAVRQKESMPMDRCRHRQTIGDVDPHPLTFHRFDHACRLPCR